MSSRPSPPEHPELAEVAGSLEETGWAAEIYDTEWRLVWVSGEILELTGASDPAELGFGEHILQHIRMGTFQSIISAESAASLLEVEPALPTSILSLVSRGDPAMFERMARLVEPGRRPAAILFADVQDSGLVSKRLPSASYFRLLRGLITGIDDVIGRFGGVVGKHAGDGATAFFIANDLGSRSGAVRAAIEAAPEIAVFACEVVKRTSDESETVDAHDVEVNVGVHWGGQLFMGQLVTGGRLEVTALGDTVNEAARIQESARDGQVLASKSLLEHLSEEDAAALGIDPDAVIYKTIEELPTVGSKARRDAGTVPVTVL